MASFKVVFQFTGVAGAQWNEVYYRSASNISDAQAGMDQVIRQRLQNLNFLNTMQQIRIASLDTARLTATVPVVQAGTNNDFANFGQGDPALCEPLPAGAAIICKLTGVNGGTRRLWVRGANYGDYQRDVNSGRDHFHPGFIKSFNAMVKAMATAGFGIRTIGHVNPISNPQRNILTVAKGMTTGTTVVTCDGNLSLDANLRMIITGTDPKSLPGLNGHYSIISNNPPAYTIRYTMPNGILTISNAGFAHAEIYNAISVFNPANCAPAYLGTRTTENPTTRSRGARRPRRLRTLA